MRIASLLTLVCFLIFGRVHGQMSGVSFYAGTGWWEQSTKEYIQEGSFCWAFSYEQFLTRNFNAKLSFRSQKTPFLLHPENTVPEIKNVRAMEYTFDLNYWYLNDIRLINKLSRESCKGTTLALRTKIKSYLIAGITYRNVRSSTSELNKNQYLLNLGLGYHFWRFPIGIYSRFMDQTQVGSALIPFFEFRYLHPLNKTISSPETYYLKGFLFTLGLKLGVA